MSFFQAKIVAGLGFILIAIMFIASANAAAISSEKEQQTKGAKPKVIEFYASWCEPCKSMQPSIDRARAQYGSEVEFVSYNVDDPAAQEAIQKYGVCPIPTLVFVNEKNQVSDYAIGCTQERILEKKMNSILNHRLELLKASSSATQSGS
jgi:thioredoxin 1